MTAQQITAPLTRLWEGLDQARRDWATRRELAQLDDRMLKDLGISRAQAEFLVGPARRPWGVRHYHEG